MISIDICGPGPFTGLICGFRFFLEFNQATEIPAELQGYELVADYRMKPNVAFLVKNGKLITTYIGKFRE